MEIKECRTTVFHFIVVELTRLSCMLVLVTIQDMLEEFSRLLVLYASAWTAPSKKKRESSLEEVRSKIAINGLTNMHIYFAIAI